MVLRSAVQEALHEIAEKSRFPGPDHLDTLSAKYDLAILLQRLEELEGARPQPAHPQERGKHDDKNEKEPSHGRSSLLF